MKIPLENLKTPLILVLYGFLIILVQIVLIRFLIFLGTELSHSLLVQVLMVALYIISNAILLYSWYKLTMYVRNRELSRKINKIQEH